ncbi:MAG TPA: AraC family transcriptional regulator [Pyrinomonadaceae bacterium]|nr:AraC family transcriptional regulator [Pyrinomonadaceae bacterium]
MDRRIQVIVARLERRVSERMDISELAREVNLSASRLRHLFKTETGKTPTQYLKQLRMRRAEVLLRTSFLSVKEIINRVGMTNSSNFVREFRKIYAVAPTVYRRSVVQGSPSKSRRQ